MQAEIKEVYTENNPLSSFEPAIVLDVPEDSFDAVWDYLERAGFRLRNWEDKKIIVYAKKHRKIKKMIRFIVIDKIYSDKIYNATGKWFEIKNPFNDKNLLIR